MNNKIKWVFIGICVLNISACTMMGTSKYEPYPVYTYDPYQPNTMMNYNRVPYDSSYSQKQEVVVPDSYHMSEVRSPVSFKDRDQTWVNSQNPQGYTIELAEGDKASKVAQVLYKAPKNDRMAQVHYVRDGKTHYKGVYGTFTSAEEAQKALNALPSEIKNSAAVIHWSNVQQ